MAGEKSRRDQHLERLKTKYPDKKFEEDEEIFGQISDDYDQYEQQLGEYKGREKTLSDMFAADPRSAQFLTDMYQGQDPVLGLVRNFGAEIKDVMEDPEKQEEIAKANKEYVERVAKNKQLKDEYEANLGKSLEILREYQDQNSLSDDQIDEVMNRIISVINDGVLGKFAPETIDLFLKGINHDADVANANEEGEVAGRNMKIAENLRKSKKGDGTMPLGGRNGQPGGSPQRERSIFDVAQDAV